jgi:hypothetical protein
LGGHGVVESTTYIEGAVVSGVLAGNDTESAVTDSEGHFIFDKANPGHQFIRVNAKGFMGEVRDLETKKGATAIADFQMTSGQYRLHGTVTDPEGKALRAEVVIRNPSDIVIERISSDPETGYFEANLLPGTYGVLATAPGHRAVGWRGEVSKDTMLNLKFEPPAGLTRPKVFMERPLDKHSHW